MKPTFSIHRKTAIISEILVTIGRISQGFISVRILLNGDYLGGFIGILLGELWVF